MFPLVLYPAICSDSPVDTYTKLYYENCLV